MNSPAAPDRVRVVGPLAPFADRFLSYLVEQGYSLRSAQFQLQFLAHVSRWLDAVGRDVSGLTAEAVEEFLAERRRQGYATRLSTMGARQLLGFLDGLGVVPVAAAPMPSPVDSLLDGFCDYLLAERGLAPKTVAGYARVARRFLQRRGVPLKDALSGLSAGEVRAFVLRESRRVGHLEAGRVVCALRALLRFLHVHGLIAAPLVTAVPSVARRSEDLPRGLPAGQVKLLLGSCDRSTPSGRRDHAVLLLLARLGLRSGEVAALSLDDVNWRAGELMIRGKGARIDRLPLPADVGEALVEYLRHGRRSGFGRALFLTAHAPIRGVSPGVVSEIVTRACKRAGLPPVRAHRLRHTIATELLVRGAGLIEVGQLLRHKDVFSTTIYAKVDRRALSRLALPWPGSER